MPEREVTITNTLGLHARAASRFVQVTRAHECSVEVESGGRKVDGSSIVGLLTLAAAKGRTLRIVTEGEAADACLADLVALVEAGFDENGNDG